MTGSALAGATGARLADAVRTVQRVRGRGRRRSVLVACALAVCVAAVFALSLSVGDMVMPLSTVVETLSGGGDGGSRFVVLELRLPRALLAILVGAGFGLSGAVFQSLLRNPLASPDVIGISAGASAVAVTAALLFQVSGLALSASALAGSIGAGAAIYLLARRQGVAGQRLVLIGVGLGTGLTSVVWYVMARSGAADAQQAFLWLTGSLNGRSWKQVWPLLAALAVLVPLTVLAARALGPLQLGTTRQPVSGPASSPAGWPCSAARRPWRGSPRRRPDPSASSPSCPRRSPAAWCPAGAPHSGTRR
ncbi:hypothetical protein Sfulv_15720 [Streptomyces fulvorobeus]|uniref:ABC transporter permease n=1 Tax=Streptomyces fulvorobeus TaxID=284028 RepID=A0A7J0C2R3_9ACTN|nr:hypothetical protein Sfulv_15720 [Streptomyces fulvorobeus]